MDDIHHLFFDDIARHLDDWVSHGSEALEGRVDRPGVLEGFESAAGALQKTLTTEQKIAMRALLFATMVGLLHSLMSMLDGATMLADHYTVEVVTSDGELLGPGLDEMLMEHLYDTGRLPYRYAAR